MNLKDVNFSEPLEICYNNELINEYETEMMNDISISRPIGNFTKKIVKHIVTENFKNSIQQIGDVLFKKLDNFEESLKNTLNNKIDDLNINFNEKINNLTENIHNLENNINNLNDKTNEIISNFKNFEKKNEFRNIYQDHPGSKFLKLLSIYDYEFSMKQLIFIAKNLSIINNIETIKREEKRRRISLINWFEKNFDLFSLNFEKNISHILSLPTFPK